MTFLGSTDSTFTAKLAIAMEYANLRSVRQHCPLGIYIVPSESLFDWDGVLFVHQGYYANSVLKFRLTFPRNFPEQPPTVHFVTDVFHPLVSRKDGLFNFSPFLHPWKPKGHHVYHILHWVKAAFKRAQLDQLQEKDCMNSDAFRYQEAISSFAALATQTAALSNSKSALYDQDHPSMALRKHDGLPFCEINQDLLHSLQTKLGLEEWGIPEESTNLGVNNRSQD